MDGYEKCMDVRDGSMEWFEIVTSDRLIYFGTAGFGTVMLMLETAFLCLFVVRNTVMGFGRGYPSPIWLLMRAQKSVVKP